jgi:hypothetical protein
VHFSRAKNLKRHLHTAAHKARAAGKTGGVEAAPPTVPDRIVIVQPPRHKVRTNFPDGHNARAPVWQRYNDGVPVTLPQTRARVRWVVSHCPV